MSETGKKKPVDALSLSYMRYARRMLQSVGAWPDALLQRGAHRVRAYTVYITLQSTGVITGQALFIAQQFQTLTFLDLGDVIIGLVLTFVILYRLLMVSLKKYGEVIEEFLKEFHLIHFQHKGEYWNHMHERVNKISLYVSIYMLSLCLSGAIAFNIPAAYNNYRRGVYSSERPDNVTAEFSVHYILPYLSPDDYCIVVGMFNMFLSYVCALIVSGLDLLLCLMIFQLIGHIRILLHTLRTFPTPQAGVQVVSYRKGNNVIEFENKNNFGDQENKLIAKLLKECIHHHRFIVSFTERLSNVFGPMLAVNYMYHLVGLSIQLVECMQGKKEIVRYGPLSLITLAQLLQLSIIFEVIGAQSEKLIDAVYCLPWESMSIRNQKTVLILLKRVQTPIRVAALGMVAIGVNTMAGVLKTTLSYCAFFRTLK